jgi:hypothetical protein
VVQLPLVRVLRLHKVLVESPLGSVWRFEDLIYEACDETNTTETTYDDLPPKPFRLFGAVDPAIEAEPRFTRKCPLRSRGKEDDPEY